MAWKSKPPKGYIGLNNGFVADLEQLKWQKYCVNNGIIISPQPTSKGMYAEEWRIAVSFMPNYKKIYLTPTVYITDNVWPETFKLMKFYYDKKNE
jgi:hypothetical protein